MSNANFSRPGAVDLSNLGAASDANHDPATAVYFLDVAEQDLEKMIADSLRFPIVMVLHSPRDAGGTKMLSIFERLANADSGRWLLAKVDVDAQPRIAQALGVQAVPTVLAVLAGQLVPLFQGTADESEIKQYLEQIHQVAVANGITGKASPQAGQAAVASDEQDAEPQLDPRFIPADEAMQRGDFEAAAAEFDKLLKANPADVEARSGRSQARLLARTVNADGSVIAQADAAPDDLDLQLQAADVEVLTGQHEAAFERILAAIRTHFGDEREQLRVRLLELFDTVDPKDPAVAKARRDLSLALF